MPPSKQSGSSPLTRGKPIERFQDIFQDGLIPGENHSPLSSRPALWGSSPLTRGKRRRRRATGGQRGLIPAHAGKTSRRSSTDRDKRAHPRSRGENPPRGSPDRLREGSSPLTRGKPRERSGLRCLPGLIPAHAGKTLCGLADPRGCVAHPRSRGENHRSPNASPRRVGSSPLTRGKPDLCLDLEVRLRLIPAHAGKTTPALTGGTHVSAHPRSRGENYARIDWRDACVGSSPLTRGKPPVRAQPCGKRGLIPAHAGKTAGRGLELRSFWAHPRSRGENTARALGIGRQTGSSPLTRGKQAFDDLDAKGVRLIPAHAGKTLSSRQRSTKGGAHPRSRGENR